MKRTLVKPLERNTGTTICGFVDSMAIPMATFIAFSYRERLDPARLREALARVITDYRVYAGRLKNRDGVWQVEHGCEGVAFEVAESSQLSSALKAAAATERIRPLCPNLSIWRAQRGRAPLFGVRLTQTPDGSILGVAWHHWVGDVQSTMLLLRAWSLAYRNEPYEKPLTVTDRDAYLTENIPFRESEVVHRLSWWNNLRALGYYMTHPSRRVSHVFSWDDISTLRAAAARDRSVTPHDAVCAHVFATIRRLQKTRPVTRLALVINFRKRFGLPSSLLGNVTDLVVVKAKLADDIAAIASDLRTRIETFTGGILGHHGLMKLKATRPRAFKRPFYLAEHLNPKRDGGFLMITSWANFGIYDLVFESAPVFVHCRADAHPGISWIAQVYESPAKFGLTMTLFLPWRLARALERELSRPTLSVLQDNESPVRQIQSDLAHGASNLVH